MCDSGKDGVGEEGIRSRLLHEVEMRKEEGEKEDEYEWGRKRKKVVLGGKDKDKTTSKEI